MWYVYHLLFVVVVRSWAAMSLLARGGYVVLHALGLAMNLHFNVRSKIVYLVTVYAYAPQNPIFGHSIHSQLFILATVYAYAP